MKQAIIFFIITTFVISAFANTCSNCKTSEASTPEKLSASEQSSNKNDETLLENGLWNNFLSLDIEQINGEDFGENSMEGWNEGELVFEEGSDEENNEGYQYEESDEEYDEEYVGIFEGETFSFEGAEENFESWENDENFEDDEQNPEGFV